MGDFATSVVSPDNTAHESKIVTSNIEQTCLGSIQEDRHKVEQFYFFWKSSTFYGTVPQFVELLLPVEDYLT